MTLPPLPSIALIGGGPRAVSVLERLASATHGSSAVGTVHVIDDVQPGAGRVWRTEQPRELCMNTLADAVSLFADDSVTMAGAVRPGPTLHEWSLLVSGRGGDPAFARMLADVPPRAGLAEDYADEFAAQRPESHPSRALFGEYIAWCYARARADLPAGIEVVEHRARALAIEEAGGMQRVRLSDGSFVQASVVVLVPGWLPRAPSAQDQAFARAVEEHPGLVWIRPDSPADQPLDRIPDGADVIARGLGMNFFDAMALLTIGRGGRFVESGDELTYEPSGREPVLHVTSNRGVPFRAKSLYGGLPPKAPQRHLRGAAWLTEDRIVDFDAEAWPLILKDAIEAYVSALPAQALAVPLERALALIEERDADVLSLVDDLVSSSARDNFLAALSDSAPSDDPDGFAQAFIASDLSEAALRPLERR